MFCGKLLIHGDTLKLNWRCKCKLLKLKLNSKRKSKPLKRETVLLKDRDKLKEILELSEKAKELEIEANKLKNEIKFPKTY